MNFYELLILAKSGDDLANEKILAMYQPLLTKESVIDGVWDEDLYQDVTCFICEERPSGRSFLYRKNAAGT